MSLDYEFTKGRNKSITDAQCYDVCCYMMVCGVRKLDLETAPILQKRIAILNALNGGEVPEMSLLLKFDGLSTNVSTLTGGQFLKRFAKDVELPKKTRPK